MLRDVTQPQAAPSSMIEAAISDISDIGLAVIAAKQRIAGINGRLFGWEVEAGECSSDARKPDTAYERITDALVVLRRAAADLNEQAERLDLRI